MVTHIIIADKQVAQSIIAAKLCGSILIYEVSKFFYCYSICNYFVADICAC